MAKFKVGDRVRYVDSWGVMHAGSEHEVRVLSEFGTVNVDTFPQYYWNESRFELAPAVAPVGPTRTVTTTRTEIVPGVYGPVSVKEPHPRYERSANIAIQPTHLTADELTDAIATLTAIRDALVELAPEKQVGAPVWGRA